MPSETPFNETLFRQYAHDLAHLLQEDIDRGVVPPSTGTRNIASLNPEKSSMTLEYEIDETGTELRICPIGQKNMESRNLLFTLLQK